ncbi:DNA repair-scaffolding protein [Microtus ochrogaster]|uniref:DNA repair-scaffolding protein n=1 Tax=Microtus ochrogaster TaxID=79684 RepID=A0A8J6GDZ1_MICOH|nr:DNA repair-scaffolding protein [Microtus ochrogaster]
MEDPSEFDPLLNPEYPQSDEQDSSDESGISQPEQLAKDLKKLTLNPSAKKPPASPAVCGLRCSLHCSCHLRCAVKMRLLENKSEKILREIQSAFPKRRVRTSLSTHQDPVARMKILIRKEEKLKSRDGNEFVEGRKSGVLTVKILELHEECTMQVAVCEQLAGPPNTSPPRGTAPGLGACLKVLFTRETADHLRGHPQDIIYIFPPWQKLLIPNGSCPIILNTYFCQKAVAREAVPEKYCQDASLPRRDITLARMFRIEEITCSSSRNQIACSDLATTGTGWTHGPDKTEQHLAVGAPLRDSLLDIVESQRADPWSGVGVQVVVQRVYSLRSRDGARSQQRHTEGHADSPGTW